MPLTTLDSCLDFILCQQLVVLKAKEELVTCISCELIGQEGRKSPETVLHGVQRHSCDTQYLRMEEGGLTVRLGCWT